VLKSVNSNGKAGKPSAIVGFGASAGGLEAFSSLLTHLDNNLGMAYVLVMHLSPNHKSSLGEILQLKTKMKVTTVKNGIEVKKNNVYVIPPNTSMSIVDGHLKLAPRDITVNGNFAVDYFLTALASVYKNNSIGVILSGTATDGTLGLKAVKAEGGITFAQDSTAKFPGMPKSAYDSGYADFILSPEGIAKELQVLAKIPYTVLPPKKVEKDHQEKSVTEREVIKQILSIVKSKTGIDFFSHYKQASIFRRVVRRVVLKKVKTLERYLELLKDNDKEINELYNDFLINVTNFFRDEEFYKVLSKDILPGVIKSRKSTDPIRIWVAGCATGEEAYSIAITIAEYLQTKDVSITYQVFASDLDANAIEKARLGIYAVSSVQNISPARLKKFFKKIDGHYQVEKTIRESCVFSQHNLLKDPPFSRIDLISCQNVLIYLENDPQHQILQTFHYALKPTGFLFLGRSESIGNAADLFDALDKNIRIYSRKSHASRPGNFTPYVSEEIAHKQFARQSLQPANDINKELGKLILERYVMPCVVLNEQLTIVQFFGQTTQYLSPVTGKASFNILKMIREDLLIDLRSQIQQAKKTGKISVKEGIVIYNKKVPQELSLEVALKKIDNDLFFVVVFKENPNKIKLDKSSQKKRKTSEGQKAQIIVNLEDELSRSRELIRTTNEEYETTYEELQANNEQILSSNEELQSVNEELETSKEELQSANEELTTINDELQKRNTELRESQNYAKAIVDTVNSPFLILTSNLQVRIANKSFYETFKLTPETTEGNFIYELGDHSWDIQLLRDHLNDLLGKKTNYKEFKLEHFFPKLGDMAFVVNVYRFMKEENTKETLILLAFNNMSDLLRSNQNLKQVNEQLEQFIFVSGHDLQEPLRKIQAFSNYLIEHESTDQYVRENVTKIDKTASRMSFLLRDLLSYSSLLQNHSKNLVKVDLNKTLSEVLEHHEPIIKEKKAEFNIGQLPTIVADADQMNLLFSNLIGNSLKFNLGKPVINVTVETITAAQYEAFGLNKDKNYLCIQVSDNGLGFDQKYIPKIFSMFQRLQVKTGIEGTGMGLPICKKIVEDHGGRIFAKGKENKGATFKVYLPRG
jgi:two-component system CheB/CheR fusion protein